MINPFANVNGPSIYISGSLVTTPPPKYEGALLQTHFQVAVDKVGNVVGFVCIRPQIVNRVTVGPFYANDEVSWM